jgi:hypothetical protein
VKVNRYELYFYSYRIFMCFFTWIVLRSLIQLGDTESYLTDLNTASFSYMSSTSLMRIVGVTSSQILGDFTINLITCILVTKFIVLNIKHSRFTNREAILLYMIFSFPSFTIWTVIYSKEAIVTLAFLSFFLLLQKQSKEKKKSFLRVSYICLSILIIGMFKPQYLIFLLTILLCLWVSQKFQPIIALQIYILYVVTLLLIYLIISDLIHYYTGGLYYHFNIPGSSSRSDIFFEMSGDFITKAPYGIYLALVQYKLNEIFNGLSLTLWLEGVIISIIAILIFLYKVRIIIYGRLKVHYFVACIIGILLLLFALYPFGVFNPGSANRYKTAIYAPVFLTLMTNFTRRKRTYSSK